jgi:hypothetical protein
MNHSTLSLEIDRLQQQLSLFKGVYEEMITNEKEFDSVKPLLQQIRKLEKTLQDLASEKATTSCK